MSMIEKFATQVKHLFEVSKDIIDDDINFNQCQISKQENSDGKISMEFYLTCLKFEDNFVEPIEREKRATQTEVGKYRTLSEELIWIGCGVLHQASYIGLYMQQLVLYPRAKDLIDAKQILKR